MGLQDDTQGAIADQHHFEIREILTGQSHYPSTHHGCCRSLQRPTWRRPNEQHEYQQYSFHFITVLRQRLTTVICERRTAMLRCVRRARNVLLEICTAFAPSLHFSRLSEAVYFRHLR